MNEVSFNPKYLERIARVCHEANKAWCEINGDYSQVEWFGAQDWQRESAIKGVAFRLNNPTAPASAQHDAWMQDKLDDGWKLGEKKDAEKKEHHLLIPYEQLPITDRMKDKLFQNIVDALK